MLRGTLPHTPHASLAQGGAGAHLRSPLTLIDPVVAGIVSVLGSSRASGSVCSSVHTANLSHTYGGEFRGVPKRGRGCGWFKGLPEECTFVDENGARTVGGSGAWAVGYLGYSNQAGTHHGHTHTSQHNAKPHLLKTPALPACACMCTRRQCAGVHAPRVLPVFQHLNEHPHHGEAG